MAAISILSHIYPTIKDPSSGIFIQKEARLLSSKHKIEVLIPTVRALPFQAQYFRSKNPVSERFSVSNVKYLSIPKRKFANFTTGNLAKSILPYLESSDPDLLHIHWLFPSGLTIPKLKKLGKPIVLTLHGGDWYSNQGKGIDKLIEASLFECDEIICVGNQLKKDMLIRYPDLKGKIHHIPHGINTNIFKPATSVSEFEHLGWNSSIPNLLCVSNLYPVKGVDLLIDAFHKIIASNEAHLHIIAPRRDRQYSKQIYDLIDKYGLKNKITFYHSMSEEEIIPYYQAADVLISPSRKEGFGIAVAEAIACGTAVVATKSGGPEEIVTLETGILVENENSDAIAKNVLNIIKKREDYSPTHLHTYIINKFSNSAKIDKLNSIYTLL